MSENNEIAIKVQHISKTFHEQAGSRSFKEAFVNVGRKLTGKKEKKLSKGDYTALKDINFEVKKGEFFGIVGRNGSGKSTLLKIIAGVYTPTRGAVTINGNLTPFIELGVGFNPELSGHDNVFLNGALLGFTRKQMQAMYNDIVDFAELHDFMEVKLKNYSSGMQVRLAFSVAIRAQSDILVIDEVLAVGDAAFQQKCYNYFEQLKSLDRTVVFVSHDMGAVRRFCTRAVYIKKGKMVNLGTAADIGDMYIAENIETSPPRSSSKKAGGQELPKLYEIDATISKISNNKVLYDIKYSAKDKTEMYIGISVLKDGISIAEITTALDKPLEGKGSLLYSLDTNYFNGGAYRLDAALFKLKNRELIALNKKKNNFALKGYDITKGAALKLQDTWEYRK